LERSTDRGSLRRESVMSPPTIPLEKVIVYAIAFDLDTDMLKKNCGNDSFNNAYGDIRKLLTTKHHFTWQQGSVYFGDPAKVNAVNTVLAIMDVARTFKWFAASVRDVRMLRIEEQNDLMGAVQEASK
jgi:virulence-associated protein VapD